MNGHLCWISLTISKSVASSLPCNEVEIHLEDSRLKILPGDSLGWDRFGVEIAEDHPPEITKVVMTALATNQINS